MSKRRHRIRTHNKRRAAAEKRTLGFTIGSARWPYPECRQMARWLRAANRQATRRREPDPLAAIRKERELMRRFNMGRFTAAIFETWLAESIESGEIVLPDTVSFVETQFVNAARYQKD